MIENTDTYGGEANYSWANRFAIDNEELTDKQLIRLAKKVTGFTGVRCKVENIGELIAIYPRGYCQVIFINYIENDYIDKYCFIKRIDAKGNEL